MASSTLPEPNPLKRLRRARAVRRVFVGSMVTGVVLGLAGVAGDRTETAVAEGGGYALEVEYPSRSRAGMPAELRIVVRHPGGFEEPVRVRVRTAYLDLLHDWELAPLPSASTGNEQWVEFEFEPPQGDALQVLLVARIDPVAHRGRDGAVAVVDGGRAVAQTRLKTVVVP